jgi:predicted MFS family arabinose efflux permease
MVLPTGAGGDFRPAVNPRQKRQALCYAIEGLNSFGTAFYFAYLYFLLHDRLGFHDKSNLIVAALLGLCYALVSWLAGRLANRWGYFTTLKLGFGIMLAGMVTGTMAGSAAGVIAASAVVTLGMCFTWPVLEALISQGETPDHVPHAVGIYNITWAVTNAGALFIGGTLLVKLGYQCLFYVPAGLLGIQLALTLWLEKLPRPGNGSNPADWPPDPHRPPPKLAKSFQRMAWLANPFAYIGINTLLAVLPGIAAKFHLSPMFAGFACSLWGFVRLLSFMALWRWTGWHYRFRWLVTAYLLLVVSFATILIAPSLWMVLAAQFFFGAAVGLIYYSSLFYAMDAHDSSSEHGGIHEAAIGIGNSVGPAVGATALWLAPQNATIGAWAVSGLLTAGLGGLIWLRLQR